MFGIGAQELLIIAIVALLIVGPKKLPEIARSLGKGLQEFKKTAEDVTGGIKDSFVETEPSTETKDPLAAPKPSDEEETGDALASNTSLQTRHLP
jgi:TatA/E family protein of Tat protein translocase